MAPFLEESVFSLVEHHDKGLDFTVTKGMLS